MPTQHLDTDYLVIGAGAMSMGFVDVILSEDPTARIVMVDRHANPGGHWNDAYPFVRLHQPAAFYGLPMESLSGWLRYLGKLVHGPHDDEFIVVEPEAELEERRFWALATT